VHKIFNYESKVMQAVMDLARMIVMNLLYLVCCIPIVTIGAAQAGLYSGIRHLQNKELDTPCLPEFIKGMKSGFKTVTLVHSVSLLPLAIVAGSFVVSWLLNQAGQKIPVWTSGACIMLFAAWHTVMVIFHASFECRPKELVANTFRVMLAFPLQSILSGILLWLPATLFVMFPMLFLQTLPLIITVYYSVAYEVILLLVKKPLKKIKDSMFPAA
jgi:uncharacterized membrane protein YesL